MQLFSNLLKKRIKIFSHIALHEFYQVDGGHLILNQEIQDDHVEIGEKIPAVGMFTIYWLLNKKMKVGYYFTSEFRTVNHGGYLVTFLNNGAGKATTAQLTLKTDKLVIYNYPNRGTLAISPEVNDEVQVILEEQ